MRILFSLFFWVMVARWGYAELQLSLPGLIPYVDRAVQAMTIPTHDQWADSTIVKTLASLQGSEEKAEVALASVLPSTKTEEHDSQSLEALLEDLERFDASPELKKALRRM